MLTFVVIAIIIIVTSLGQKQCECFASSRLSIVENREQCTREINPATLEHAVAQYYYYFLPPTPRKKRKKRNERDLRTTVGTMLPLSSCLTRDNATRDYFMQDCAYCARNIVRRGKTAAPGSTLLITLRNIFMPHRARFQRETPISSRQTSWCFVNDQLFLSAINVFLLFSFSLPSSSEIYESDDILRTLRGTKSWNEWLSRMRAVTFFPSFRRKASEKVKRIRN